MCSNVYLPNFIGGAELIAHYHAKALRQMGHRAVVFAGDGSGSRERYTLVKDEFEGIPVYRIHLSPDDYAADGVNFHHPEVDRHFDNVLDLYKPDVVHMHNIIGLSAKMLGQAKQRGIPVVVTLHDFWGFCLKNTLIKSGQTICDDFSRCFECLPVMDAGRQALPIRMRNDYMAVQFASVDRFISPSEYLARQYMKAGLPLGKMRVIWNGLDVNRFARLVKKPNGDGIRFTFIGYLGEHKGVKTLLDAFAALSSSTARLNLVGEGHLRQYVEDLIRTHALGDRVRLWGKIKHSEIESVFRETDVQILPSIWPENQPVSITESMASRTPVIGTRMGGVPELVVDGETGYLFEGGDSAALSRAMRNFIDKPERVAAFGEAAFLRIADKTFDRQVGKILELYDEAARDR